MPSLSKYKKAISASGKFQKALTEIQKTEYGLDNIRYEGEQQRSMYSGIGATVANVLGIIDEKKKLSEFNQYKDVAAGLPGVRLNDDGQYVSAITGRALSDPMLYAIGKQEILMPGESKYSTYLPEDTLQVGGLK